MSNNKDFKVKNGIQPTVYHEGLGTVVSESPNYNIAQAVLENTSPSVNAQETNPNDVAISSDGTKMYIVGNGSDSVHQYTMSTAFDVSTASYDSVSLSVLTQCENPSGLTFSTDGSNLYVTGITDDNVAQYSLSTPWSLATATYSGNSFDVSTQEDAPRAVIFSSDGFKMYISGTGSDAIHQYNLTTEWDVSSASYSSNTLDVSSEDISPQGLALSSDGTKLFMAGNVSDTIYQYNLSTANDLSTATYSNISFSVAGLGFPPTGVTLSSDGSSMYVVISGTVDTVSQYSTTLTTNTLDLSTGSVFEVTPTSNIQVSLSNPAASGTVSGATLLLDGGVAKAYDIANATYDEISFSVASQDGAPSALAFKPDGSKMYIIGYGVDAAHEYDLSTAWDVSTSSFLQSFSVAAQETLPTGVSFKPDGTKMYVAGNNNKNVNEYDLSTAWDISTAVYSQAFYVGTQATGQVSTLAFKPDGTKMYVGTAAPDIIYEYDLSTAWDVSSSTYNQNLDVQANVTTAYGLEFKPDGTRMYILDYSYQEVNEYELSTAWDVSSGSYLREVTVNAAGQTQSWGLALSSDGEKLYFTSTATGTVYQYSVVAGATITYATAIEWPSGTAPTSPAIGETDVVTFNTRDGGSTYQGILAIDGAK